MASAIPASWSMQGSEAAVVVGWGGGGTSPQRKRGGSHAQTSAPNWAACACVAQASPARCFCEREASAEIGDACLRVCWLWWAASPCTHRQGLAQLREAGRVALVCLASRPARHDVVQHQQQVALGDEVCVKAGRSGRAKKVGARTVSGLAPSQAKRQREVRGAKGGCMGWQGTAGGGSSRTHQATRAPQRLLS